MAFNWYTVQTYSGQESRVVQYVTEFIEAGDLDGLVRTILSPTQEIVQVKNGEKIRTTRKFFPGYVLVEMELCKEAMHFIQNVNGVMGFVGGQEPRPLKESEINRILGRESEAGSVEMTEVPFEIGDAVKIMSGPFKDFDGTIEELSPEKGKAKVMVSVFGRSTPVEVDFGQVEPVS